MSSSLSSSSYISFYATGRYATGTNPTVPPNNTGPATTTTTTITIGRNSSHPPTKTQASINDDTITKANKEFIHSCYSIYAFACLYKKVQILKVAALSHNQSPWPSLPKDSFLSVGQPGRKVKKVRSSLPSSRR